MWIGLIIGLVVLIGVEWGVWTLTAPMGRTWQIIFCILAFFLPSILYRIVKAVRK